MFFCAAVLLGVGSAKIARLEFGWPLIFLGCIFMCVALRRKGMRAIAVVILCGLAMGLLRGSQIAAQLDAYKTLTGKKVTLRAVATEDAVYAKNGQLSFTAKNVTLQDPYDQDIIGKIRVSGFGESMVYKGDIVQAEAKLFTTRGSNQAQMSFASIDVVGQQGELFAGVRRDFAAGMYNALPEPAASFGLGLLIGQRATLPDDVSEQLRVVGLTHIIAVSGYNLTIIIEAIRRIMTGKSKYVGVLVACVLVCCFLLITGFSASVVRAAIVSMLSITAWYYGRKIKSLLLILFVAAITALWNPLYVWSDIGWYLSFLAFFGILIISPLVSAKLHKRKQQSFIGQIMIETVSAQLMTMPLILYIFKQISFVSFVSNLLTVPLIPYAMLFSLIAGLAGMFASSLAGWFAWPAMIALTYVLDVAALLSKVPHAQESYAISLTGMLGVYIILSMLSFLLWLKVKRSYATITEKNS